MTNEGTKPTTRRAVLLSAAATTATLAGCSGSNRTSTEATSSASGTPTDSPTASPTSAPQGTPEAVQHTLEEARRKLNAAFVELNTVNPWRKDGYEYYMDRYRFFNFEGDVVRKKANEVDRAIDDVESEIPDGTKAESIAASLASTALLARAASKQFEALGRATLKWGVGTGQFKDGNYSGCAETMNEGLDAMNDFEKPALEVADALKSLEAIGFVPEIPAFKASQWPDEQHDLGQVWVRASDAFRGYRRTALARQTFSQGERAFSEGQFEEAIELYTEAALEFENGGRELFQAIEDGLEYYNYRAGELACIAPEDRAAMTLYEDAASAFANDDRERGTELRAQAANTRQEARANCRQTETSR